MAPHRSNQTALLHRLVVLLLVLVLANACCFVTAYVSGVPSPPVDRRALAGLWKLTPSVLPLKEFTVKRNTKSSGSSSSKQPTTATEVLLMLKADGSFRRLESLEADDDDDDDKSAPRKEDIDQSWKDFRQETQHPSTTSSSSTSGKKPIQTLFQGTWDYRDGQLILAADRDEQKARSDNFGCATTTTTTENAATTDRPDDTSPQKYVPDAQQQHQFWTKRGKDTLLMGTVVATTTATPPSAEEKETTPTAPLSSSSATISVPVGSVNVGRFFYPKHHPSFFDQPMFSPQRSGIFKLQQILRTASAEPPRVIPQQKFRTADFHDKRFFLTTHPLQQRRPKGNIRWSIKYNKFVEDPPSKEAQARTAAEENRPVPTIRVMQVMIHANNTFSTIAGLGDTTILRGNFNVIGDQRDQVWMQTLRFGFGRKVSGSTYSEGNALGEETKSFWGKISYESDKNKPADGTTNSSETGNTLENGNAETGEPEKKRLQVEGSVIVGWGLEPEPVARFIMKEAEDDADFREDYDDDDEEEDDSDATPEDEWPISDVFQ